MAIQEFVGTNDQSLEVIKCNFISHVIRFFELVEFLDQVHLYESFMQDYLGFFVSLEFYLDFLDRNLNSLRIKNKYFLDESTNKKADDYCLNVIFPKIVEKIKSSGSLQNLMHSYVHYLIEILNIIFQNLQSKVSSPCLLRFFSTAGLDTTIKCITSFAGLIANFCTIKFIDKLEAGDIQKYNAISSLFNKICRNGSLILKSINSSPTIQLHIEMVMNVVKIYEITKGFFYAFKKNYRLAEFAFCSVLSSEEQKSLSFIELNAIGGYIKVLFELKEYAKIEEYARKLLAVKFCRKFSKFFSDISLVDCVNVITIIYIGICIEYRKLNNFVNVMRYANMLYNFLSPSSPQRATVREWLIEKMPKKDFAEQICSLLPRENELFKIADNWVRNGFLALDFKNSEYAGATLLYWSSLPDYPYKFRKEQNGDRLFLSFDPADANFIGFFEPENFISFVKTLPEKIEQFLQEKSQLQEEASQRKKSHSIKSNTRSLYIEQGAAISWSRSPAVEEDPCRAFEAPVKKSKKRNTLALFNPDVPQQVASKEHYCWVLSENEKPEYTEGDLNSNVYPIMMATTCRFFLYITKDVMKQLERDAELSKKVLAKACRGKFTCAEGGEGVKLMSQPKKGCEFSFKFIGFYGTKRLRGHVETSVDGKANLIVFGNLIHNHST